MWTQLSASKHMRFLLWLTAPPIEGNTGSLALASQAAHRYVDMFSPCQQRSLSQGWASSSFTGISVTGNQGFSPWPRLSSTSAFIMGSLNSHSHFHSQRMRENGIPEQRLSVKLLLADQSWCSCGYASLACWHCWLHPSWSLAALSQPFRENCLGTLFKNKILRCFCLLKRRLLA